MMTNAGSSRAHWFFVCLWYDVCRYLQRLQACSSTPILGCADVRDIVSENIEHVRKSAGGARDLRRHAEL